ncbi:acyl carrier protein [Rhodococcus wratislaviensis]|uniref:Carrier domain-containing protein n=1 Tax=Rhodococcus wratislaviensis NBRC 100605 TaxID=1219028 RepID=X0QXH2_RHOWR|nr:acyl carrier protein [Rhodococcus wratislaviensis]GAF43320.1 hypothetical protein RW1_006_02180 [Rhodococcus wratislaviensis NBRC 100605]
MTCEDIVQWCQQYLASLLAVTPESLDPNADFDRLGLDSPLAVSLLIEIEERFGVDLPPEDLFENPTLNAVGEYVHQHLRQDVA